MHKKLVDTFSKFQNIILVGGGTGGHIQPIITIAGELHDAHILWVGGKNSNEEKESKRYAIPFRSINTLKLETTSSIKTILYPFFLLKGILEARNILKSYTENSCVFSKGGPGSVAIGIAAWSLKIPLYIHESDTIPGRSNRVLAKLAQKIFLGFESATKYFNPTKCEYIGQILSKDFESRSEKESNSKIQWKTKKPHILVICGSQGSKSIFETIIEQFEKNNTYEWIISLGKLNQNFQPIFDEIPDTQAFEWISQEDIASLLSKTDIAITRGSATTLAEIDTFGVRKVIIPLPHAAQNHQYWNARVYEERGDILLEESQKEHLKTILESIVGTNSKHGNTSRATL